MGLHRKYAAILEKMLFSIFMGKKLPKMAKNGQNGWAGISFQPIKIERNIFGKIAAYFWFMYVIWTCQTIFRVFILNGLGGVGISIYFEL